MTKDDAIKLALEALEEIHVGNMTPMAEINWNRAITAIREALAQPEPASNEQDAFEQKFPMPRYCSRFTGGYAATDHNAWDAHSHCLRWEGWKARANTTPPQQEPVAWEISGKLTALREVQAFVDKHVREVEDSLRQLSNTTPAAQRTVVAPLKEDGTDQTAVLQAAIDQTSPQPEQEPPFSVQQARAMAQVCLDLHEALGCKWGDNPYLAIANLRKTQPQPAHQLDDINVVDLATAQQNPVATKVYDATTGNTYVKFLIDECLLPIGTVFYATSQAARDAASDAQGMHKGNNLDVYVLSEIEAANNSKENA